MTEKLYPESVVKELLRETAMRCNIAFPETEKDNEWFEQGLDVNSSGNFMLRLFAALELGKIDTYPTIGKEDAK
jgi:hypothetical protein